ncbi:MAG TPA: hypothetical protein VES40_21030, partial [Ilumatobacteraceae bacterium]|nr:hypothetical protein [Ilumatobacteraceae bacterium]
YGRAGVVKVHRQSHLTRERLAAIVRVHTDLVASGAPAPFSPQRNCGSSYGARCQHPDAYSGSSPNETRPVDGPAS